MPRWERQIWACAECGTYSCSADQAASCCGAGALPHDVVHASDLDRAEAERDRAVKALRDFEYGRKRDNA